MKSILLGLAALFCYQLTNAQHISVDLYGGIANYQGDLQSKRFSFSQAGPSAGLGLSYHFNPHFAVRGAATYLKIKGSDVSGNNNTKDLATRNLSFKSSVWEAQLAGEYTFFDLEERSLSPYIFAGIAAYHFNPYAYDSTGNKVFLRGLGTEGQGLAAYPEKKLYKNNQFAIPFGAGIKFAINPRLQLGIELGLRKLFTDYLDDVSGTYADSAILAAGRGQQAVAFAFRGKEVDASVAYPAAGSVRGNPKNKDWYYTTGIKLNYSLGQGNGGSRNSGRRSKTGCPTNIY
ncbi:MAG: DUF6089 family protein [Ferruginibacter sp.]